MNNGLANRVANAFQWGGLALLILSWPIALAMGAIT